MSEDFILAFNTWINSVAFTNYMLVVFLVLFFVWKWFGGKGGKG